MPRDIGGLLALWEAADGAGPAAARRLLAAAGEGDAGAWPLGRAVRRLIAVRAQVIGAGAAALCDCPACGERVEIPLPLAALAAGEDPSPEPLRVATADGFSLLLRPVTLADLEAAGTARDPAEGAAMLLAATLLAAEGPDGPVPPQALSEDAVAAAGAALDAADPLADPALALDCPGCGTPLEAGFDAAAFLADELGAAVRHAATEVALLARAYGWSEAEILAMSPARRRLYRELAP